MSTGLHFIAGKWVESDEKFLSSPAFGRPQEFAVGTAALVGDAVSFAEAAFPIYLGRSRGERSAFLSRIAVEIEARGDEITEIAFRETGLSKERLVGERARTVGQLQLFADCVQAGDFLDLRHDPALPDRKPMPRPDLKLVQRPIGPVAVFGASNFPLAFSVAGGDTASALAAGCPVVVKGHSAHPGTSEIVARAMSAAIDACGMPAGVFSLIQGGKREVGEALVTHPHIRAVGFTGSLSGGRALFDLCAQRPEPIPFFGELGSVNPMFLLPGALAARGPQIAVGWANSLVMGAGQFCTKPGTVIVLDGADALIFANATKLALTNIEEQTMLSDGIATAYREGVARMAASKGVMEIIGTANRARHASPYIFSVGGDDWLENDTLREEVFGPLGIIVKARDLAQVIQIAEVFTGQLTCTLHMDAVDIDTARKLLPILERKAGRVIANGFPTGVEVCEAMVHGGPYPASTNFGATSVGSMSIRRWLRPVCYQGLPDSILPLDCRP